MDHFAHADLIRIHQADLRAAADHQRLVAAARRAGDPGRPRVTPTAPTMPRPTPPTIVRALRRLRLPVAGRGAAGATRSA